MTAKKHSETLSVSRVNLISWSARVARLAFSIEDAEQSQSATELAQEIRRIADGPHKISP